RTSTGNTKLVTVVASNVSFNFGTGLITANTGSGFFIINDAGIAGEGQITVSIPSLSLSHVFTWSFNNTGDAVNQTVDWEGTPMNLNVPNGPFNLINEPGPLTLSVTAASQTQSLNISNTGGVVVTLVHPDSGSDYATVGVSGLSTTLGAGGVTLALS